MDEQGKGRYDRSRYQSGARPESRSRSSADSRRSPRRYRDTFYEDMLITFDDEPQGEEPFEPAGAPMAEQVREASDQPTAAQDSAQEVRRYREPRVETTSAGVARRAASHARAESRSDGEAAQPTQPTQTSPVSSRGEAAQARPTARRSVHARGARQQAADGGARSTASHATPGAGDGIAARFKSRSTAFRVAIVAFIAAALVVLGIALAYVSGIAGNLRASIDQGLLDTLVETDMANEPFYMLVLGIDKSTVREGDDGPGGMYRSDTIVLARVDAPNRKVTMVTIPRDTLVDIEGYGQGKANSAYAYGGPALAVKTISKLAGVPISHYVEADFDGFIAIVDALGGVEVNVPMYIDDPDAEGVLEAGEQTLDGKQALVLARARAAYEGLAGGDLMRAANQRMLLGALAQKALSADIGTIARTVQTASKYVSTDLALNDIIGLAQALRGFDTSTDLYTASAPSTSQIIDELWYEVMDESAWKTMMKRVDSGEPPVTESQVNELTGVVVATAGDGAVDTSGRYCSVVVENTTDTSGLAMGLQEQLIDTGYSVVTVGGSYAGYAMPNTTVVYDNDRRENEAKRLLDDIGQGELFYDEYGYYNMEGGDFLVLIGADWQS